MYKDKQRLCSDLIGIGDSILSTFFVMSGVGVGTIPDGRRHVEVLIGKCQLEMTPDLE